MIWGFDMIRYNRRIQFNESRSGQLVIESDRGDKYETQLIANSHTPLTDWWNSQHQSELRTWQKDAVIGEFWRQHGELELYLIYKKGQGYSQPHDMTLAYSPSKKIWLFATESHTWIYSTGYKSFSLDTESALGSVLDYTARQEFYQVLDGV